MSLLTRAIRRFSIWSAGADPTLLKPSGAPLILSWTTRFEKVGLAKAPASNEVSMKTCWRDSMVSENSCEKIFLWPSMTRELERCALSRPCIYTLRDLDRAEFLFVSNPLINSRRVHSSMWSGRKVQQSLRTRREYGKYACQKKDKLTERIPQLRGCRRYGSSFRDVATFSQLRDCQRGWFRASFSCLWSDNGYNYPIKHVHWEKTIKRDWPTTGPVPIDLRARASTMRSLGASTSCALP